MKSLPCILTAACLAAVPVPSFAELGPIVITPTRTAQTENTSSATVYVVTAEEIEASGATTTSQLLRGIPGVQIDDLFGNGTQVNISVRGFSGTASSNTLVLVNGRRLNHSDTAGPDIHHVFPKDIERIEVLVGSAGSIYGDQAVGGVINIILKKAGVERHQLSARVGSFDYRGITFNSSNSLNDSLGYRLSAEIFETNNYRDHNFEKNNNFLAVLEYSEGANDWYFELQRIDDELELPGALSPAEFEIDPTQINPAFANDFINEDTSVYRLGYRYDLGKHELQIDTSHRNTEAPLLQSRRNSPSPASGFIDREHSAVNPKISGMLNSGIEMPYVAGIDLERSDFDANIPSSFNTFTANNSQAIDSLYFQVIPRLTEFLHLTYGMRHSSLENDLDYSDFGFPVSTRVNTRVKDDITVSEIGLAWFADERTKFSLRYDENFRFAKIDEFTQTIAPTILETQTGESLEFGIELTRGDQQFNLSIYQLDLENEIDFDPTAGSGGLNVNLDETRREGLTLSWFSQLNPEFALKTEIGLVDARFASGVFDGNEISGVSDQIASLRGDYQISDFVAGYLELDYTGERFPQGDNGNITSKLDSITILNAGVGYIYKNWDLDFRINNLTDKNYAEFVIDFGFGAGMYPSPERNFSFTASYTFE